MLFLNLIIIYLNIYQIDMESLCIGMFARESLHAVKVGGLAPHDILAGAGADSRQRIVL
jgi:hypothetical protein